MGKRGLSINLRPHVSMPILLLWSKVSGWNLLSSITIQPLIKTFTNGKTVTVTVNMTQNIQFKRLTCGLDSSEYIRLFKKRTWRVCWRGLGLETQQEGWGAAHSMVRVVVLGHRTVWQHGHPQSLRLQSAQHLRKKSGQQERREVGQPHHHVPGSHYVHDFSTFSVHWNCWSSSM